MQHVKIYMKDFRKDISIEDKPQSLKLFEIDKAKGVMMSIPAGGTIPSHTTPVPAWLIALEGTCQYFMEGSATTLEPGSLINIPAHIPHSLEAITNVKVLLIR